MLFVLLLHIFAHLCCLSNSQPQNISSSRISLGSSLSPATDHDSFWLSTYGQFAFGFYKQPNATFSLAIWFHHFQQKTVVWTANRDAPLVSRNAKLVLSDDGRLVLQDEGGLEVSISDSDRRAAFAAMLNSGNFVVCSSDSTVLWQSFDHPTDTLLPAQRLAAGHALISAGGRFQLVMQANGNLVQFPRGDKISAYHAYWYTATEKAGNNLSLHLDPDGKLYLLNSTGFNIKNIYVVGDGVDKTTVRRLTLDFDGILRLYEHGSDPSSDWEVQWSPNNNNCDPVGLCGVNSYCSLLLNKEAQCLCLAGFDIVDPNQKSLGCARNSSNINACSAVDGSSAVSFEKLEGLSWEDNSYSVVASNDTAACEDDCRRDCNCQVALFTAQQCKKLMFPLRFAKTAAPGIIVTTVVKVRARTKMTGNEIKKAKRSNMLTAGLACITIAMIVLLFSFFLVCRCRLASYKKIIGTEPRGGPSAMIDFEAYNLRSFTFDELNLATNGFTEKLGRGAFGTVFKGTLPNGQRAVAVKRLEKIAAEGEVEFRNEMMSISRTHHRNLLRLLGYCDQGSNRLLVYDYMSNGSLSKFLFDSEARPTWEKRLSIAVGIARGILYLHEECESQIIHCDINPNNILIDENGSAKIADFGLAKLLMPDQTRTVTGLRGTRGFVCPEWYKNLPITAKADVYSFGVVLFVVICCRRSVDVNAPEREAILVDWVYECFKADDVRTLVRDEQVEERELERAVKIGLWCIHEDPAIRPTMKKVVAMLEGTLDIPVPPNLTSYHTHSALNIETNV